MANYHLSEELANSVVNGTVHGHEYVKHAPAYAILFIFAACILGAIVRQLMKDWSLPYTVVLIIFGVSFGAISRHYPEVQNYTKLAVDNPHLLLATFLPVLLFESAFAMDVHIFYKMFTQVCILAVPGMTMAAALSAVMAKYVFYYGWSWMECFLFGSIISATDPVAVVALLGSLGTSKQLGTIIEGESLLNDGAAIVLFHIFFNLSFKEMTVTQIGLYFPRVAFGGMALGLVAGKIIVFWLQRVFNDAMVEISVTLSSTYLIFYIGEEVLGVSGVLAVVMLGIEINQHRTSISPEVEVFLHRFWEILAYLANTLIFLLVGVAIMERAFDVIESLDWLYIIVDYFGIIVIRAIVIILFSPFLTRLGYGLPWKDAVVMIWGGLRGAVGLALALQVALDHETVGNKILIHTAGIVLLTLLINATTIRHLLKLLGMSEISESKKASMNNAVKRLDQGQQQSFAMLKTDRFLADADWSYAEKACCMINPYAESDLEDTESYPPYLLRYSTCPECETKVVNVPSPKEFSEMAEAGRIGMLKAQKMSFWRQFERGVLSSDAVNVLVNLADTCLDVKDRLIKLTDLSFHWKVPRYWERTRVRLEKFKQVRASETVPPPRNLFLRYNYLIATHVAFDAVMNALIALNMVPIAFELSVSETVWYMKYLKIINYVYCGVYIMEAMIKILAFRVYYFKDKWNLIDLTIVALSVIDVIVDLVTEGATGSFSPGVLKLAKIFKILRMGRLLKLMKGLIPKLIDMVNNRINRQLSFGYDIGKGFVVAEEEIAKIIDQLVLDPKIAGDLKTRSDYTRLQVVKSLGLLQREHPGIAISVKTRQAIRSVLNNARDALNDLRSNGVLDKHEAIKLERDIEVKMKQQLRAPAYIPPKKPEDILRSLVWLQGLEEEAISYITSNAELSSYDYGDTIVKQGECCDGIYLIISGMVKLVGVSMGTVDFQQISSLTSSLQISADYLYAGNVIGEMGLLTDSVRNASVICETTVQAYFVGADKIHRAMKRFKGLTEGLWRVCGIRIAVPLLMEHDVYKIWSKEYLRMVCENSHLAHFDDISIYHVPENVKEAVLIQGNIICFHTKEVFRAPALLPKNKRIYCFGEAKPQVLLILNQAGNATSKVKAIIDLKGEPETSTEHEPETPRPNSKMENGSHRSAGCQVKQKVIEDKGPQNE
ncbi:sodium/hydrogen exchanger 10-like [Hydractinia symbiolongicarpus]|uniref:sodium/hydrogen exchanger 10-like n=1 Tax=Hydractinia symbiolongicarpus TaxID=13093 RepID=UPI00254DEDE9|nr:sodium/hydrogen exchanger 10-like [Hydractinia symbiolongicarpus]